MRPEDRDAARRITRYVAGMTFDDYLNSSITRSAVERELTIVGEALKAALPPIPPDPEPES